MNDVLAIAFSLSKAWSYRAKKDAIDKAGSFEAFVQSSKNLTKTVDFRTAEKQLQKLKKQNGWLWIYGDKDFPSALAKISDPPLVVYGLGQSKLDEENTLAFIGTRNPTPYGRRIALWLAKDLVREGLTLVSGLARGIDSMAHKASIDSTVPTVAVLAHGLDMVYPPENKKMADEIVKTGGTIISELPFGIKPLPGFFPRRNRIISGLSKAILVIEAGEKSGTRQTVNHALEQCREVFAVPGPIDSEFSSYTNELIFTGANMVRTSLDILDFYPNHKVREGKQKKSSFKPTILQNKILQFLDKDTPKSIEDFLTQTKIEPKQALQSLTELELHGKILKQPNSTYILSNV